MIPHQIIISDKKFQMANQEGHKGSEERSYYYSSGSTSRDEENTELTLGSESIYSSVTFFEKGEVGFVGDELGDQPSPKESGKGSKVFDKLLRERSITNMDRTLMLFIDDRYGWVSIHSMPACDLYNKMLGQTVYVNIYPSAEPIIQYLVTRRVPEVIMPSTVTISMSRFSYKVTTNEIVLTSAVPITDENTRASNSSEDASFKTTYCFCPCPHVNVPRVIGGMYPPDLSTFGECVECIMEAFGENILSVLWMIGDCLLDSGTKRCFILYGPGGRGKTTITNMIKGVVSSATYDLAPQYFVSRFTGSKNVRSFATQHITSDTKAGILATRLVLVQDVEISGNDELNVQTVKTITGGDAGSKGVLSKTMIASCNELPKYKIMNNYVRNDRTRRIVIIPTVSERLLGNRNYIPEDLTSKSLLVSAAILVRLRCDTKPPLTRNALMHTLFLGRIKDAERLIKYDDNATFIECYNATRIICRSMYISYSQMQDCLCDVGSNCCIRMNTTYAIAGIVPKPGVEIMLETEEEKAKRLRNEKYNKRAQRRREEDNKKASDIEALLGI